VPGAVWVVALGQFLLLGVHWVGMDVHGYSWGDIAAASWAAASFLALLAPRGIFSREPGR
jgi:hypothetical protein